ncbi:MAG: 3'(2'),5'-bisphosphate nucleotidase [Deltaproteobacteria bacterium]
MTYELERRVALEAVIKACKLCSAVQAAHLAGGVIDKEDKSPVTVADFGAQAVVSDHLSVSFPRDPLVGEEDSELLQQPENARIKEAVLKHAQRIAPQLKEKETFAAIDRGNAEGGSKGRFWTLDPIDGTKGFLRGDQYAVALALIEDGQIRLGVLGCPSLPLVSLQGQGGSLFVAVRGEGSTIRLIDRAEEKTIRVAGITDPSGALFCESFESSHSSHDDMAEIIKILGVKQPPLRMDSQAKYGILARGDGTVYLRLPTKQSYVEKIWDHAAGCILVEEAGGTVTDLNGKPLDFSQGKTLIKNKGVIATNGKLHNIVLSTVQRVVHL